MPVLLPPLLLRLLCGRVLGVVLLHVNRLADEMGEKTKKEEDIFLFYILYGQRSSSFPPRKLVSRGSVHFRIYVGGQDP